MPEAVTDRPTSALEYVFLLTKSPRYFWDAEAVRVKHLEPWRSTGQREGFNTKDVAGTMARECLQAGGKPREYNPGGRNFRNTDLFFESLKPPYGMIFAGDEPVGLDVTSAGLNEKHFASFPRKLVRPLILASTSERGCCPKCLTPWVRVVERDRQPTRPSTNTKYAGTSGDQSGAAGQDLYRHVTEVKTLGWRPGCECVNPEGLTYEMHDGATGAVPVPYNPIASTVLDCYCGSGTAGIVATQQGRNFIGIDASAEYCEMARRRIANPEPEPVPPDAEGQMMFEELAT